jgi:hypothetical protein
MKKSISFEEMSQINGGSKFWDGFCAGVLLVDIASPWLLLTGIGTALLGGASVGCAVYYIATQ